MGGVLTIVIGLVLNEIIVDQAASTGGNAEVGSFSGAQAINDLVPLVYITAVVMLGIGMIGIGAGGFMGRGPMR